MVVPYHILASWSNIGFGITYNSTVQSESTTFIVSDSKTKNAYVP